MRSDIIYVTNVTSVLCIQEMPKFLVKCNFRLKALAERW